MGKFNFSSFQKGIEKIKSNPQLVYTILVAVVITGAFVFMAQTFIGIANSAQERLINVRMGSLQDAFVSFAGDNFNDTDYLNKKISDIIHNNETILNFRIVTRKAPNIENQQENPVQYNIIASNSVKEINDTDPDAGFLYLLASSDPSNSITIQFERDGERLFNTARAITDTSGNVLGVIMTTQTLSQADKAIENSIVNSIILLVVILVFIMFLFLRHSKIIDYTILYKKLKEVDQLKDDFMSMASHELRTPLAIIRGYIEFIEGVPDLSKEAKDYASKIDASAKDLDLLVNDMLDVNRIQQGRMSFKFEKINPTELLEAVISSFMITAKNKNLALSFETREVDRNVKINVDQDRLKQVLVNLIGNAIKYTEKGEVKVRQYVEDKKLYIRVSDTGFGISAEEQKKLFEKFYRIRTKETENIRGTGLGLWITAEIVKEMKGFIFVESIKGVGSHFIISFPLA